MPESSPHPDPPALEAPASCAELEFCESAAHVFELLGKRWSGLIVDLLLQRPARFSELARAVPGLSERVLAERLRELEQAGICERTVGLGPPVTVTYALTDVGRDLEPAMEALRAWAVQHPRPAARTRDAA